MFVNLYVQEPDFGEHNVADFLDRTRIDVMSSIE